MLLRPAARSCSAAGRARGEYWGWLRRAVSVGVALAGNGSDRVQGRRARGFAGDSSSRESPPVPTIDPPWLEPASTLLDVAVSSSAVSPAPSAAAVGRASVGRVAVDNGPSRNTANTTINTTTTLSDIPLGCSCVELTDTTTTTCVTRTSVPLLTSSTGSCFGTSARTCATIAMSATTTSTTSTTTSTPSASAPSSTTPPPATSRSFTAVHFSETEYEFEGGLRRVRPYYADAGAHCKARWRGLSLRQVYEREFHSETMASYEAACALGRLTLNGRPTHLEAVLRDGDAIRLRVHRHEPAVSSRPAVVVAQDGDLLAVDKPASLPVHPCGRYRHSSLLFVLAKECGVSGLHTLHRLDRLASGLVVFAKTREASRRVDEQIRQRMVAGRFGLEQVHKEYVCRVAGEFPAGELACDEPLSVVEGRLGVSRVDRLSGKPSRSLFRRLRHDAASRPGGSSLLSCVPVTGRSHQLRVHLQSLGFPVLLDPVYGSPAWAGAAPLGEILRRVADETSEPTARALAARLGADGPRRIPPLAVAGDASARDRDAGCEGVRGSAGGVAREGGMAEVVWPERDPICTECRLRRPDPRPRDLGMCLHALRYSGPGWSFEVPMPDWAAPDWTEDRVAF